MNSKDKNVRIKHAKRRAKIHGRHYGRKEIGDEGYVEKKSSLNSKSR